MNTWTRSIYSIYLSFKLNGVRTLYNQPLEGQYCFLDPVHKAPDEFGTGRIRGGKSIGLWDHLVPWKLALAFYGIGFKFWRTHVKIHLLPCERCPCQISSSSVWSSETEQIFFRSQIRPVPCERSLSMRQVSIKLFRNDNHKWSIEWTCTRWVSF